ncbi:hypothetical protein Tco_0838495 [Tanacetum coccineum]|uniref:Uncharacterized protein n=1 Tax=Tanacetum coccineum TaxID=301880 RepID=A0ABQ5AS15_9ASTR
MSNRHQELASPKQTALCCTKALATPEQTATGKEISNPLTADSLLKTIREDEMLLKIKSQISSASTLVSTGRRVSIDLKSTYGGADLNGIITKIEAYLSSPTGPRKFASAVA